LLGLYYAQNGNKCTIAGASREELLKIMKQIADKLVRRYNDQIKLKDGTDWRWFEDSLTYSNYKLPEALLRAYQATGRQKYLEVAEESLSFLGKVNFEADFFSAIGQDGWYFRDGKRSYFDQQPEDASSAAEGLVAAFEVTGRESYKNHAKVAFDWFLGKNHLSQMLYDEATGGCYDGLGRESINFNQGAESTLSYLLARLAMERIK
jgi:uncharacterized protein YyaL (SSP411 family)